MEKDSKFFIFESFCLRHVKHKARWPPRFFRPIPPHGLSRPLSIGNRSDQVEQKHTDSYKDGLTISKDREFLRRRLRPDWKRRNLFGVYLEFWIYLIFLMNLFSHLYLQYYMLRREIHLIIVKLWWKLFFT